MKLKITYFIISGLYFVSVIIGLLFGGFIGYGAVAQPVICILFLTLALTRKVNKQCNYCHAIIQSSCTFCGNCGVKI
jgi:hypothetical protein